MPTPSQITAAQLPHAMDLILDATAEGIFMLDAEGRCTLINRAASAMTGWPPEEGLGRPIDELLHRGGKKGASCPDVGCLALAVLQEKTMQRGSEVYWRRDGTSFPVEYAFSPIVEEGRITGALVVFNDIGERLRTAKTMHDQDEALCLITDTGPSLISYFDSDCSYSWVNKTYARWLGLAAEDIKGRHISQILGEEAWQIVQPYIRQVLSGAAVAYEHQLPLPGGQRWLRGSYTPYRDDRGRVSGFVEYAVDIGEHKEATETYRATLNILEDFDEERRNVRLLQKATINLLEDMHDERNRVDQTQRATLNILEDFDEEKAMLQNLQVATMNLLDDVDEERRNFQLIQKATLNLLEDMNTEREKSDKTQRALINILDDAELERGKAEQANVLMEAVNKELEAFSYSVSHDLRAPLRAISGFTEALMEDWAPRLDDEGKRYLGLVQENAHKMGQLIDDLLAFSRLGRQVMTMAEIDMAELAQSVFAELKGHIPERCIHFSVDPVPPAQGDKALIRQVLVNLISNAIKFTRTRGKAVIEFGCQSAGNHNTYYLRDNGVGFEMQYAGKLFGVFQRLHSVSEFEGTGVGLALVYRIVSRHGGTVRAEGEVDCGASFFFSLGAVRE